MSKIVTFTNTSGIDIYPPKPAVKDVPQWYIDTKEYVNESGRVVTNPGSTPHTIKKCIPVFDAMTAGYILYTQVDIQVTQTENGPYYTWPSQDALSFHPLEQGNLHPSSNNTDFPKWINPYVIKTPPGYSVLITQPFHRESVFTILTGIVDTDKYKSQIHFPFVLKDSKWSGIIDAGTPLAQIIPFKRDSWKQEFGSEKEMLEQQTTITKLRSMFFNSYKKQFWTRKEFR